MPGSNTAKVLPTEILHNGRFKIIQFLVRARYAKNLFLKLLTYGSRSSSRIEEVSFVLLTFNHLAFNAYFVRIHIPFALIQRGLLHGANISIYFIEYLKLVSIIIRIYAMFSFIPTNYFPLYN